MILRATLLLLAIILVSRGYGAPEKRVVDGVTYYILRASADSVRILWKDNDGTQLRTFPAVARYLANEKVVAETLMNGGIFDPDGAPSGLLIQDGQELKPVNR